MNRKAQKDVMKTVAPEIKTNTGITRIHKICYYSAGMLFVITILNELAVISISKNGWFSLIGIVALLLLPELKKLSLGKLSIEK